jgi:hypothetical protein
MVARVHRKEKVSLVPVGPDPGAVDSNLGDPKLGGMHVDEKSIWYILKESLAHHALTRATYTNISPDHFTWRGERSGDGKIWEEFLIVDVHRTKN